MYYFQHGGPTGEDAPRPPPPPPTAVEKLTARGTTAERRAGMLERWKDHYGAGQPDPYIQIKAAVLVIVALTIWSFYVVVGTVCTPMIRGTSSSGFGRAIGAGTLVGFVLLWLIFVWSYLKMIMTGPGFARDYMPQAAPPNGPSTDYIPYHPPPSSLSPETDTAYPSTYSILRSPSASNMDRTSDPAGPDPSELAPVTNMLASAFQSSEVQPWSSKAVVPTSPGERESRKGHGLRDWRDVQRPLPELYIGPRWCRHCEINKPDRAHHCRHCGTCVLQFDHHCLWIGQCVGWANHKFFINFNTWAVLFTVYIMVLLIIVITKSSDINGQMIGLIAVSAMFCLFSAMILTSHLYLILTGKTTVESFAGRDQVQRETDVLQREYGYLWHNLEKRKVKLRWKKDWGGLPVDARWKFGTSKQMWEQEMGVSPLGWLLPVGRPLGNGIHFPSNPRFGPNGEWLQRKDWPKDLR